MIDIEKYDASGAWRLEDAGDGIGVLVFDVPDEKVNILSEAVLEDLDSILMALAGDKELRALVVIGGKAESGTFIAGANIEEIRAVSDAATATKKAALGQSVLTRFATLPAVTIAAIHGSCLGGGTELTLACDLRIASNDPKTRIGLPEVLLGIIPGFGGSQRLPRLVGILPALPIVLTGKPVDAAKASKIGLVDRVTYPGLLRDAAIALAKEALGNSGKSYRPRRVKRPLVERILQGTSLGRAFIKKRALAGVEKTAGPHYPAPRGAIDAMIDGYALSLEEGLALEARIVGELIPSSVSKNLIDLFQSSEKARRGRSGEPRPDHACLRDGGLVGLLGAGVMGGGLAGLFARKGWLVRMKDIAHESIRTGLKSVYDSLQKRVQARRMTKSEAANHMAAITSTLEYQGFQSASLVVEAVVENLGVKKQVLAEMEKAVSPEAILATNTSSLSVSAMQEALARPDRFIGLHFFNPVDRMMLVEIIRGVKTSDEAVAIGEAIARRLGKIPVKVGDGPGFLVNRLLSPYLNESVRLFEEGFSPYEIDRAIRDFGMPMGPFELLDEVGLDVAAKVSKVLHEAFGERARPPELMARLESMPGVLGKKSGKGFYLHRGKKRRPNHAIARACLGKGNEYKLRDPELWVKRLVYPLVNEAAMALGEGIVGSPEELDLAMVMGTGFAPFRGGPLRFADAEGPAKIVRSLEQLREPRLAPCDHLRGLAARHERFYPERVRDAVSTAS